MSAKICEKAPTAHAPAHWTPAVIMPCRRRKTKAASSPPCAQLPESYREVLYLHYFEGYSLKEIGALLNIRVATAGTWLALGRENSKRFWRENTMNTAFDYKTELNQLQAFTPKRRPP